MFPLVGGASGVLRMIESGAVTIGFNLANEAGAIRKLLDRPEQPRR